MNLHVTVSAAQHHPPAVVSTDGSRRDTDWSLLLGTRDTLQVTLSWADADFLATWLVLEAETAGSGAEWGLPGDAGTLRLYWTVEERYSASYDARMTNVHVHGLEIADWNRRAAWAHFASCEGHQVVAMIRLGHSAASHQVYLGRAQRIETLGHIRRYYYAPRQSEDGEDLTWQPADWASHVQQAWELERIRGLSRVSLSPRTASAVRATPMDNDAFHNDRRVLPVRVRPQDSSVQCQFFNLRDERPCVLETQHLVWQDMAHSLHVHSMRLTLTALISLTLRYTVDADGVIILTELELEARQYRRALALMGAAEGPRTI